jgi:folate-dependent phosphoribosylglycinamide formyltransferase PurN
MKTLLIYQEGARLDEEVMLRWLASFSELVGAIMLQEARGRKWTRVQREIKRVGFFRFADVVAFRAFYRFFLRRKDDEWEARFSAELAGRYPPLDVNLPVLRTATPNSDQAVEFIRRLAPDMVVARCKTILQPRVFSLPGKGTFVMHPGIVPEYRNSHGCFWALSNREHDKVGMTLLKIDEGVDTGPVYGHFSYEYDERTESHAVIQKRVVFENLDAVEAKLLEVNRGEAKLVDTSGRRSAAWGQPWLTKYLMWKWRARRAG